jgi:GH15 family glucan-1,4-alpha-glucosidase
MAGRIEDYAMIGNCLSAALVCRDGSIDWLCLPRFDRGACFAALLGTCDHGRWLMTPEDPGAKATRRYRDGGLVLETVWEGAGGSARVIDFMPVDGDTVGVIRIVEGLSGSLRFRSELVIRFDYGRTVPWVVRLDDGAMRAVAGPDLLVLRSPVAHEGKNLHSEACFEVGTGQSVPFVMTYGLSHLGLPVELDAYDALERTETFWAEWSDRCNDSGEWSEIVRRSLVTLKGLSYLPTGGIVAAPTTSLPEKIGGSRNWDYRFCWARDATYVLTAFVNAGYHDEAIAWREWVRRAIAGTPDQLQVMYGLSGERRMHEHELAWLPGYENSGPVRIGNAAAEQFQLDIFGEIAGAFDHAFRNGVKLHRTDEVQELFLGHLAKIWRNPDEGIWEIRGEPQHFVHSKIMAWLAFRRAADQPMEVRHAKLQAKWAAEAEAIRADVLARGVHPEHGYLVQAYGSVELDASLLIALLTGFLDRDDPRFLNTVRAVEKELLVDGFVLRYDTGSGVDGLEPGEGVFLACSFWLVENYVMLGRMDDAETLFRRLIALRNDVGLLAEEYEPRACRMLGNFPQAFSHVALINAAFSLAHARSATAEAAATPGTPTGPGDAETHDQGDRS